MFRALLLAAVIALVLHGVVVAAAPSCPHQLLPSCVYLPVMRGPTIGKCQLVSGDGFDDATAWLLDEPLVGQGAVTLTGDAVFLGGVGLRIDPQGAYEVGVRSMATVTRSRLFEPWVTFRYRRASESPGGSLVVIMMPKDDKSNMWALRRWSTDASGAPKAWREEVVNMTESANQFRGDLNEQRIRVEANGTTVWHMDDLALWLCPPGVRPGQ